MAFPRGPYVRSQGLLHLSLAPFFFQFSLVVRLSEDLYGSRALSPCFSGSTPTVGFPSSADLLYLPVRPSLRRSVQPPFDLTSRALVQKNFFLSWVEPHLSSSGHPSLVGPLSLRRLFEGGRDSRAPLIFFSLQQFVSWRPCDRDD